MLPGFTQPDPAPQKHHLFEFTVTGLTDAEAAALMEFIGDELAYYRAVMHAGGGVAEVTADGEALEAEPAQ